MNALKTTSNGSLDPTPNANHPTLEMLAAIGTGPIVVFGAHPDDGVLGVGGFAAQVVRWRRTVFVTATRGERGGDPRVRTAEDQEAARVLGVELIQWDLPDCGIVLQEAFDWISATLQSLHPSIGFVHWPEDSHQDHRMMSEAARSACRQVPTLLYYEGPTSEDFKPLLEIDISAFWQQKHSALMSYSSEMERGRFMVWADDKARQRSWPRHKGGYCETFGVHHVDLIALSTALAGHRATNKVTVFATA